MTPRRYAHGTVTPADRSIAEIQKLVKQHGARSWRYEECDEDSTTVARIGFVLGGWPLRFTVRQPTVTQFLLTPTGLVRTPASMASLRDGEERRRWREVLLLIKAKLVAIDAGVVEARSEWLPHLVLDNDETLGEYVIPRLAQLQGAAQGRGHVPLLLPAVTIGEAEA